jgi:hypothetical protein
MAEARLVPPSAAISIASGGVMATLKRSGLNVSRSDRSWESSSPISSCSAGDTPELPLPFQILGKRRRFIQVHEVQGTAEDTGE